MQRIVCHLDMDAFFASVEEKNDPSLEGKPVLVAAGPVGRGAVASCNYIARKLGVKTGMSTQEAVRLYPHAVVVRANYDLYQEASEKILRIIYRFTPDVEPLSLDESFFELTHSPRWRSDPKSAAEVIQAAIDSELQLGASIGVSSGKVFAKIGSDFKKPHGITLVPFGGEAEWIAPLPIKVVPGIGYATERKLTEMGVQTCGDILRLTIGQLHNTFGQVHGDFLWNMVRGRDDRPLTKRGAAKSISHQSTLQKTTSDKEYIESLLLYIAERCLWRLRASGMKARGASIYMRFADGRSDGRAIHLKHAVQSEQLLLPIVSDKIREVWRVHSRPRVTFVGVSLFDFQPATDQEELFMDEAEKKEAISRTLSNIREKFGSRIISTARTFDLHHSYRLSQAGLSFSTASIEKTHKPEQKGRNSKLKSSSS